MNRHLELLPLPARSPLAERHLQVLRFGRAGARPRAYLQASLHADETPAMLVLNHLAERLRLADRDGAVRGEVVVVPIANPIGLAQTVGGRLLGRYALDDAGNFNRHYPDLLEPSAERVAGRLGDDAATNVALVRAALVDSLAGIPAHDEVAVLRHTLLGLALEADFALDLHCDDEALVHLFLGTSLWPAARDLAARCGAAATLLADVSGGNPFDEAVGGPWWGLAARFPDRPLPPACLSATIELRGDRDVDEDMAATDADGLFRFLQGRGVLDGDPGPVPALRREAAPLAAAEFVRSPCVGVVCWHRAPGDEVRHGDLLCTVVDPAERDFSTARHAVHAGTDGLLFARRAQRMTAPGEVLAKIAGSTVLPERSRGPLLTS